MSSKNVRRIVKQSEMMIWVGMYRFLGHSTSEVFHLESLLAEHLQLEVYPLLSPQHEL
jgi:high-affinity nickel permease